MPVHETRSFTIPITAYRPPITESDSRRHITRPQPPPHCERGRRHERLPFALAIVPVSNLRRSAWGGPRLLCVPGADISRRIHSDAHAVSWRSSRPYGTRNSDWVCDPALKCRAILTCSLRERQYGLDLDHKLGAGVPFLRVAEG